MSGTVRRILDEIMTLPETERVEIADGIWRSLGEEEQENLFAIESSADPEYRAELNRRLEEVRLHPEKLLDWEEAKARLMNRPAAGSGQ